MRLADLLEPAREVLGHRDEAALTLHRLEHDARDVLGGDVLFEQVAQGCQGVVRPDTAVGVRRRRAVHLRGEGAEAVLVGDDFRRQGHGQVGAAVEGVVERDHRRPSGCDTRDLHCVLDRLGARVQ